MKLTKNVIKSKDILSYYDIVIPRLKTDTSIKSENIFSPIK